MARARVLIQPVAEKDVKALRKKYRHIAKDLETILQELENNPNLGDPMKGFGECNKIRVKSSDMQRGKSGGFRVITRPHVDEGVVEVWWIYAVSEEGDPGTPQIRQVIERRIKEQDRTED